MKKIIFVFALLYFISCQPLFPCDVTNFPKSEKECFKRDSKSQDLDCCFLQLKIKDTDSGLESPVNICCPGQKNFDEQKYKEYIELYGKAFIAGKDYKIESYECKSTYIKVGLLLLLLLFI